MPFHTAVNLIGAPDDRGVLNVGGRLGAGHGPQAVRAILAQFMLGIDGALGKVELHQGFDVALGETIEAGHAAVRAAVSSDIQAGTVPVVIGGGHDYGFPHVAGVSDALGGKTALINVDAHLDVRPPGPTGITSGSPFFLALESGAVRPDAFVELGIQDHCNDEAHHAYLRKKDVRIISLEEARAARGGPAGLLTKLVEGFARRGLSTVVSFDLDAVQMAHAPGVSAPQSDGLSSGDLLAMARLCGENRSVASVGFFELAPPLDHLQMTTRLVATAIHRFLTGLSRRNAPRRRKTSFLGRMRGRR